MTPGEDSPEEIVGRPRYSRSALAATFVSLVGLADAVYLTVHHYTAEPVPCTVIAGCEQVLSSAYATLGGILTAVLGEAAEGIAASGFGEIPLAALGALAYFTAFSFALLTAYGNTAIWKLFGIHVILMALFTGWLVYLQGVVIGAFCQFCLISAATTFTLLAIFLISKSPFRIRL
jgi:uncharacterized membrane protein